jgi:O-antigen/teichoic acid export membrane protein
VLTLRPARAILNGLNLHGFVALESTLAALLGIALCVVNVLVLDLGLVGAALAVSIPQFALGLVVPFYVSSKLDIRLADIFQGGYLVPVLCAVPFGVVLLASRLAFAAQPLLAVGVGSAAGALVLLPLYWKYVAPQQLRQLVLARLPEALLRRPSRVAS